MEPTANTQPILTRTSDAPIGIFDSGFGGLTVARDIAKKIESELEYPGQIKVNVIRETKAVEYAK